MSDAVSDAVATAGARLAEAARTGVACAPVRDLLDDVDAAYAVQSLNIEGRIVGHKIGLTSAAVQRQLGVFQPDFGVLTNDMAYADGQPIPLTRFIQPRVEAEIAFVLGQDLTESPTVADVLRATAFVLPAIEIVDSRIAGWDIRITDTIADNASAGAFVLGTRPTHVDRVDLTGVGVVIEHGGVPVSTGAGAACMGSPVVAVTWLAGELVRRGRPLRAGHIVLSGALGPVVPVTAPGVYRARVEALGDVRAVFVMEES